MRVEVFGQSMKPAFPVGGLQPIAPATACSLAGPECLVISAHMTPPYVRLFYNMT